MRSGGLTGFMKANAKGDGPSMPGLVPGLRDIGSRGACMAGTSPAMTQPAEP
jgi:hypothetical protein